MNVVNNPGGNYDLNNTSRKRNLSFESRSFEDHYTTLRNNTSTSTQNRAHTYTSQV